MIKQAAKNNKRNSMPCTEVIVCRRDKMPCMYQGLDKMFAAETFVCLIVTNLSKWSTNWTNIITRGYNPTFGQLLDKNTVFN